MVIYRLRKTDEWQINLKLHIVPKALHEFGRIMQTDKAFINCVIRPFLFYRRDRKEKVRKKIFYFFLLSDKSMQLVIDYDFHMKMKHCKQCNI